jgi:hypothetical protein
MQETKAVKTYRQLSDVLQYVQAVHRRVDRVCGAVGPRLDGDPPRALMMYFRKLEADCEQTLHTAANEQPAEVLETWIQYMPTHAAERELGKKLSKTLWSLQEM